jgi:cytochrome c biogenesis protein CcmG/thiol:disulfide interchange protein DsbE
VAVLALTDLSGRSDTETVVVGRHQLVDKPAPPISLVDFEGRRVSLADYAGRPVLINFWASYCVPCRVEFPLFKTARQRYAPSGLEILGVIKHDDSIDAARAFYDEQGATWPALPDPGQDATRAYSVGFLPTTFYVDRAGIVRSVSYGPPPSGVLDEHLRRIIGDAPASALPSAIAAGQ